MENLFKHVRLADGQKLYEQFEIEREKFFYQKNKEYYYGYHLKGELRGNPSVVNLYCKDKNSYRLLDLIFDTDGKAFLVVETPNKESSFKNFLAVSPDEDGSMITVYISPKTSTDRSILLSLISKADAEDRKKNREVRESLKSEDAEQTEVKHVEDIDSDELVRVTEDGEVLEEPNTSKKGKK